VRTGMRARPMRGINVGICVRQSAGVRGYCAAGRGTAASSRSSGAPTAPTAPRRTGASAASGFGVPGVSCHPVRVDGVTREKWQGRGAPGSCDPNLMFPLSSVEGGGKERAA